MTNQLNGRTVIGADAASLRQSFAQHARLKSHLDNLVQRSLDAGIITRAGLQDAGALTPAAIARYIELHTQPVTLEASLIREEAGLLKKEFTALGDPEARVPELVRRATSEGVIGPHSIRESGISKPEAMVRYVQLQSQTPNNLQ